jgi:hypothetical protein
VTTILIGVLYYVYNWWYNYLIIFVLIPAILLLLPIAFFLVESPSFLHDAKNRDEYLSSLRTIASYNGTAFN